MHSHPHDPHNLSEEQNADYRHYTVAGAPADIAAGMLAQASPIAAPAQFACLSVAQRDYARACRALTASIYPLLVAEIDAWAGLAGLPADDVLWHYTLGVTGACSGLVLRSSEGMVLGRNYDFFYFENRRHLISTRPAEGYAHIGMHEGLAGGRFDGLNERGLFVSFNGAGQHADPAPVGLTFHHVVRYLLEHCASVADARRALATLPVKEAKSYLLVDAAAACVMEVHPARRAARTMPDSGVLVMTNHYTAPDMVALCPPWPDSVARMQCLQAGAVAGLSAARSVQLLQRLLSEHGAPVCGHADGLATFWSCVAQPGAGDIRYSLGAPCRNPYQPFHG